ncbi:cache domain-containing protein [Pararhodospirillum photometricum]|uniref:Sensor protein n=1 Tax=Pararhodospirillum photometricum DSM 122 TaxID=1150469 RepID=H6SJ07_PARPM|nr:cache domain-containing protein [Pararhodospirillum photometricum]CCG07972.1 Sensor protein [Pararhodospirillum photometricum DSM 122]
MALHSLRSVLLASAVTLTVASGLAISAFAFNTSRRTVEQVSAALRHEIARQVTDHLRFSLEGARTSLREVAFAFETGLLSLDNPSQVERAFLLKTLYNPVITAVKLGTRDGGIVAGLHTGAGTGPGTAGWLIRTEGLIAGPLIRTPVDAKGQALGPPQLYPGYDTRERSWYQDGAKDRDFVCGSIYAVYDTQDLSQPCSLAITGPQGVFLGVAGADLQLSEISAYLARLHTTTPGLTFIIDRQGNLVATSTGDEIVHPGSPQPPRRLAARESKNPLIAASAHAFETQFPPGRWRSEANATPWKSPLSMSRPRWAGRSSTSSPRRFTTPPWKRGTGRPCG